MVLMHLDLIGWWKGYAFWQSLPPWQRFLSGKIEVCILHLQQWASVSFLVSSSVDDYLLFFSLRIGFWAQKLVAIDLWGRGSLSWSSGWVWGGSCQRLSYIVCVHWIWAAFKASDLKMMTTRFIVRAWRWPSSSSSTKNASCRPNATSCSWL